MNTMGVSRKIISGVQTHDSPAQTRRMSSQDTHSVNFGTLEIGQEKVALTGEIYCPFTKFKFQVDEVLIMEVNEACVDWAVSMGIIQESDRKSAVKWDFARFAMLTHPRINLDGLSSADDIPGSTFRDKQEWLVQNRVEPLQKAGLVDATKWLFLLFPLDDNLENLDHPMIIKEFLRCVKSALENTESDDAKAPADKQIVMGSDVLERVKAAFTDEPEIQKKCEKDFAFLNTILKALESLGKEFKEKFDAVTECIPTLLGYKDFCAEVVRYIQGNHEETVNRLEQYEPDAEHFDIKRLFTSAVYTVYMVAIMAAKLKVPSSIRLHPSIVGIEQDFSHIICRSNALFSAARELGTPNWVHNDLYVIKKTLDHALGEDTSFEKVKKMLFAKINHDMRDGEKSLSALPMTLEDIVYTTVTMHWGIGSLMAQALSQRYFKLGEDDQKTPFIASEQRPEVTAQNFWDYLK